MTSYAIFSLSGCKTIELAHVDLGCINQAEIKLGLSEKEIDVIIDAENKDAEIKIKDKIIRFKSSYLARIETQCEINKKHDEAFK